MKYVIITRRRRSSSNCPFCGALEGVHRFELIPENESRIKRLYLRHSNCRCTITQQFEKDKTTDRLRSKNREVIDCTQEVLRKATPGKGKIEYLPAEVVEKMNKTNLTIYETDKACAEWLYQKFGGNLKIIQTIPGRKTADFIRNGEMWELKTFRGAKVARIDDKLRAGVRQSSNRAVIIDIAKESRIYNNLDLQALKRLVEKREVKQLIIKRGNDLVVYWRLVYKNG
jgi:hypothetical protein